MNRFIYFQFTELKAFERNQHNARDDVIFTPPEIRNFPTIVTFEGHEQCGDILITAIRSH